MPIADFDWAAIRSVLLAVSLAKGRHHLKGTADPLCQIVTKATVEMCDGAGPGAIFSNDSYLQTGEADPMS